MGSKRPTDFATQTAVRVQDLAQRLDPKVVAQAVQDAFMQYSIHRPLPAAADLVGSNDAGGGSNDLVLPDGTLYSGAPAFVDGFSRLDKVEFPVDQIPEATLNDNVAYLYRKPTGLFVRIASSKLKTTDAARIFYTVLHTQGVDDASKPAATPNDGDFAALCDLAASYVCQTLAASYSQGVSTSLGADVVDGMQREQAFATRSKELLARYDNHMGIEQKTVGASGASSGRGGTQGFGAAQDFVALDPHLETGFTPLTHPRRIYRDQG